MMVVIIDNYDSFTYNLVQILGELGVEIRVYRNDAVTPEQLATLPMAGIVISPGPGRPVDAGISKSVVRKFSSMVPILGVCLGHQIIGEVFGGNVIRATKPVHGGTSAISHDGMGLFTGLPQDFSATRYHSLVVERDSLPPGLLATAWSGDGELMGLRHSEFPVEGVQFHPESILTEAGYRLLANFADLTGERGNKAC